MKALTFATAVTASCIAGIAFADQKQQILLVVYWLIVAAYWALRFVEEVRRNGRKNGSSDPQ